MSEDLIKVAVVGYGHLGKWHCQKVAASKMAKLVCIVENFEANKILAKTNHPEAEVFSSVDEAMDSATAFFIVTPTSYHFELVEKLLKKGKHVFCEKPLTHSLPTAKSILDLKLRKEQVLQVGHSERFHQAWELLNEYSDYLRGPLCIRIARYAPFKGRATDVDVVSDVMIHDLDLMLFLLKENPHSVLAQGYKIRTNKVDHAHAQFHFKSGHHVSIIASRNHVKEVREVEITSSHGCLVFDLMTNQIHVAFKDKSLDGSFVSSRSYEKRDHLQLEHNAFYKSINQETPPVVNALDGFQAVKLIDAVLGSIEKKSTLEIS